MAWWNREILKVTIFIIATVLCMFVTGLIIYQFIFKLNANYQYPSTILGMMLGYGLAVLILEPIDKKWRTEYG
jgi:hypothetical protein